MAGHTVHKLQNIIFLMFHFCIKCSHPFLQDMRYHDGFLVRFLISGEFLYVNVLKTSWFSGFPYKKKFFHVSSHKIRGENSQPFFTKLSSRTFFPFETQTFAWGRSGGGGRVLISPLSAISFDFISIHNPRQFSKQICYGFLFNITRFTTGFIKHNLCCLLKISNHMLDSLKSLSHFF